MLRAEQKIKSQKNSWIRESKGIILNNKIFITCINSLVNLFVDKNDI
jgi:hypothetical protein